MPSQSAIYAGRAGSGSLNLRLLGGYLRSGAGLGEPVREGCILAITGECDNAFEWAAHEPEALRSGCRSRSLTRSESGAPTADVKAPFETVVELIRQGSRRDLYATTYDAAVALLAYGFPSIWCRRPGSMPAPPRYPPCAQPVSPPLNESSPLLSPAGGVCSGVEVV